MSKVNCKHCGFQWVKGEDSGHSKDECIERLKVRVDEYRYVCSELSSLVRVDIQNNTRKEELWFATQELNRKSKDINLATEQGETK